MLDLLLIHPGAAHGIYGELGDELTAVEPPLWCRIIAAYVRDRGRSVRIVDAEAEGLGPERVAGLAYTLRPRLVCIAVYGHQPSASTQQMTAAGAIARAIREVVVSPIVMCGGHVSALPERTLLEEAINFACVGEGPATVAALLDYLDGHGGQLADVPGLVWRNLVTDKVVTNKPAPLTEDLAAYSGDAWDLLPMRRYRAHNWQCFGDLLARQPYASIYTSLGCPFKCSFCCINAPFGSNRYRMRDSLDVVAEVMKLRSAYGVRTFKIVDEMFVLNERHYRAVCEGLVATGFAHELNIWAYARVDTVRGDALPLMRRAGIRWLALGIESGSAHVRDGASKPFDEADIRSTVLAIQAAGINVIGNFIFGLPDDDEESMRRTLALAQDLGLDFANFYSAMAYPGSRLYAEALERGWVLPASWRGYSQHNDDCRPLDTKHVDAATVLRSRDLAFDAYFSDARYLEAVGHKFGSEARDHVERMTRYRLSRKLLGGIAA